jgi:hypothetical protein
MPSQELQMAGCAANLVPHVVDARGGCFIPSGPRAVRSSVRCGPETGPECATTGGRWPPVAMWRTGDGPGCLDLADGRGPRGTAAAKRWAGGADPRFMRLAN